MSGRAQFVLSSSAEGLSAAPDGGCATRGSRHVTLLLRLAASTMLIAGASLLTALIPALGLVAAVDASDPQSASAIALFPGLIIQTAIALITAAAAGLYLSGARGYPLPFEERSSRVDAPSASLLRWALAFTLVAVPAWPVLGVVPLWPDLRRAWELLAATGSWGNLNGNMVGYALMPILAALTPPSLAVVTWIAFVVASTALLLLLVLRHPGFPRFYVATIVLLAGLVIATARSATAAAVGAQAIQQLIDTSRNPRELAPLTEGLARYISVVRTMASALAWSFGGYLLWLPVLALSRTAQDAFASRVDDERSETRSSADLEAITRPPRFPL